MTAEYRDKTLLWLMNPKKVATKPHVNAEKVNNREKEMAAELMRISRGQGSGSTQSRGYGLGSGASSAPQPPKSSGDIRRPPSSSGKPISRPPLGPTGNNNSNNSRLSIDTSEHQPDIEPHSRTVSVHSQGQVYDHISDSARSRQHIEFNNNNNARSDSVRSTPQPTYDRVREHRPVNAPSSRSDESTIVYHNQDLEPEPERESERGARDESYTRAPPPPPAAAVAGHPSQRMAPISYGPSLARLPDNDGPLPNGRDSRSTGIHKSGSSSSSSRSGTSPTHRSQPPRSAPPSSYRPNASYTEGHKYFKNYSPPSMALATIEPAKSAATPPPGPSAAEIERERQKSAIVMNNLTVQDIEMLARAKKFRLQGEFIKDYDYDAPMQEVYHEVHRIEREMLKRDWVQSKINRISGQAGMVSFALGATPFCPLEAPDFKENVEKALNEKRYFLERQYDMRPPPPPSDYSDKELYLQLGLALIKQMKPKGPQTEATIYKGGFRSKKTADESNAGANVNAISGAGSSSGTGNGVVGFLQTVIGLVGPVLGIKTPNLDANGQGQGQSQGSGAMPVPPSHHSAKPHTSSNASASASSSVSAATSVNTKKPATAHTMPQNTAMPLVTTSSPHASVSPLITNFEDILKPLPEFKITPLKNNNNHNHGKTRGTTSPSGQGPSASPNPGPTASAKFSQNQTQAQSSLKPMPFVLSSDLPPPPDDDGGIPDLA